MKRRIFVRNIIGSGTLLGVDGLINLDSRQTKIEFDPRTPFNLKFAPKLGMFQYHAGSKFQGQIEFMAANGFGVIEDMGFFSRGKETQNKLFKYLIKEEMTLGTFIGHKVDWFNPSLCTNKKAESERFLIEIKESISIARAANCKQICIYPGPVSLNHNFETQRKYLVENIKRAIELVEPWEIQLLLVPVDPTLYKGQFISTLDEAISICRSVGSRFCKILFDVYSQQKHKGNLIDSLLKYWDEIGYFQLADIPGKKEPFTGEINFVSLLSVIQNRSYKGFLGLDHGISLEGIEGEKAILNIYRELDFMVQSRISNVR